MTTLSTSAILQLAGAGAMLIGALLFVACAAYRRGRKAPIATSPSPPPPTPPPAPAASTPPAASTAPESVVAPSAPEIERETREDLDALGVTEFARRMYRTRRLANAAERAAPEVMALEPDWLIARNFEIGGFTVPFLLLGKTGAFAVIPTDSWVPEDLELAAMIAAKLKTFYPDICADCVFMLPLHDGEPRVHFNDKGESVTVMPRGHLARWLDDQLGPGLSDRQTRALRQAAESGLPLGVSRDRGA